MKESSVIAKAEKKEKKGAWKIAKKTRHAYEDLGKEKKLITSSSGIQISKENMHKKADNKSSLRGQTWDDGGERVI